MAELLRAGRGRGGRTGRRPQPRDGPYRSPLPPVRRPPWAPLRRRPSTHRGALLHELARPGVPAQVLTSSTRRLSPRLSVLVDDAAFRGVALGPQCPPALPERRLPDLEARATSRLGVGLARRGRLAPEIVRGLG